MSNKEPILINLGGDDLAGFPKPKPPKKPSCPAKPGHPHKEHYLPYTGRELNLHSGKLTEIFSGIPLDEIYVAQEGLSCYRCDYTMESHYNFIHKPPVKEVHSAEYDQACAHYLKKLKEYESKYKTYKEKMQEYKPLKAAYEERLKEWKFRKLEAMYHAEKLKLGYSEPDKDSTLPSQSSKQSSQKP